ncbi:MAG TPA: hypothetical protein PL061_05545 [Syntrophales bacterium]|jgi:hypothetical protein|nr:hypothetical protein [Syntrophales bacterium]
MSIIKPRVWTSLSSLDFIQQPSRGPGKASFIVTAVNTFQKRRAHGVTTPPLVTAMSTFYILKNIDNYITTGTCRFQAAAGLIPLSETLNSCFPDVKK